MEAYIVLCFISMLSVGIQAQSTVNCTPVVTPDLAARITTNSVILNPPSCCFGSLTGLNCTSDKCEVWLVAAVDTGVNNFNTDKTSTDFLSKSPYPSAFSNSNPKNYFLTKAGLQNDFPCPSSSTASYFRVGADGNCITTSCNGVLPQGSTASFKYLLVDPASKTLLAETKWSDNITLYTSKDPGSISDSFAGRSGAMVVITAILSVAMALLLLLLIIAVALCCCGGEGKEQRPASQRLGSVMGSFRIPRYDTHHLKDPAPYDNPAYERERKYTTADTLPKSSATTAVNPASQDDIKMQKM
ncbi:uroplakin-3b [Pygocentrus nattereri]|uniref:Uroplakin 3b n=1 Tax=Pygocentrus nattereri TaxID=42514 RepID=A0A3B4CEI1_PYGNA|nr:uroplakin-3b [Pygocentrus nattereri]